MAVQTANTAPKNEYREVFICDELIKNPELIITPLELIKENLELKNRFELIKENLD